MQPHLVVSVTPPAHAPGPRQGLEKQAQAWPGPRGNSGMGGSHPNPAGLPQPLRVGSGLSTDRSQESGLSLCGQAVSITCPRCVCGRLGGAVWSGREVYGVFSSIRPGGWRTTEPGGAGRGSSGFDYGEAWWPEGPLGYPVRGSQDSRPLTHWDQLLQSPLPGLRQPSARDRTVWSSVYPSAVWRPQGRV